MSDTIATATILVTVCALATPDINGMSICTLSTNHGTKVGHAAIVAATIIIVAIIVAKMEPIAISEMPATIKTIVAADVATNHMYGSRNVNHKIPFAIIRP